jgi:glycosyltransferase involved in cell wall biosynthesis
VLYICIPVFNEAPTVGLVLWKLRKVLQEYSREYEVVIYDDGSTDGTRDTLAPYADVLPLTIIGSDKRLGYAAALDALVRQVTTKTRYPRRDAMIIMQGDLTDQPDDIPELARRFEGGADIIVAERTTETPMPVPVRRLRRLASWLSQAGAWRFKSRTVVYRPAMLSIPGVIDPFGSLRLYRISILRDLVKARGKSAVVENDGWAANAELLLRASAWARRVETVTFAQRFDLRPRESRVRPWIDARALFRFSRTAGALGSRPTTVPASRRA